MRINELHTRNQSKIMEVDCLTDHMSSLSTNQGIFVPLDGQDYIDQKQYPIELFDNYAYIISSYNFCGSSVFSELDWEIVLNGISTTFRHFDISTF